MLGVLVLSSAVVGGSTIGIVSNYVTAETPLLKNAWRQMELGVVVLIGFPFVLMYQKAISKYQEYRHTIKELEEEQDKLEFEIESRMDRNADQQLSQLRV